MEYGLTTSNNNSRGYPLVPDIALSRSSVSGSGNRAESLEQSDTSNFTNSRQYMNNSENIGNADNINIHNSQVETAGSNSNSAYNSTVVTTNNDENDLFEENKSAEDQTNDQYQDPRTFAIGAYRAWKTPIGHGSFSEVYKGYHERTKRVVAIKSLRINRRNNINRIKFEINIMKNLNHPNIIRLYEVIESSDEEKIHLVMEYCSGGTLEKFIDNRETLSESQVHHYLKNLNDGLKYLRKKNILHRDLKPHNLLISEDNSLKISDFGLSTLLENDKMTDTLCGSPLYMAPEVIMNNIYGVKSDLWSVGIILYQLIYGKHPFKFKNIYELIQEINTRDIVFPPAQVSQNCVNLMKGLLVVDNNHRICWGEFFRHPWLTQAEFVDTTYKVSQPIKIPNRKEGFVNDFTIADYNPSFCQYDPITNSEPVPKMSHFNHLLRSSAGKSGDSNQKYNNSGGQGERGQDSQDNNVQNTQVNSDRILRNSMVKKKIGHRYAVSFYNKKDRSKYPDSIMARYGGQRPGIRADSSQEKKETIATKSEIFVRRDIGDNVARLSKDQMEKERLKDLERERELERREKELERREKELKEREIIKITVQDTNYTNKHRDRNSKNTDANVNNDTNSINTDNIQEIGLPNQEEMEDLGRIKILNPKLANKTDEDIDNGLLTSIYGFISAPFKYFFIKNEDNE